MLDSANQALQQRVLTGGLFGGGGACDCSGDECALCQANFGAGALDLDRVDSLTRDSPILGVGDMPALGGMPADAINSIDEIAAWQGTVYGNSDPVQGLVTDGSVELAVTYMHLYFAWNIDNPDTPCHRDMWEVAGRGGCGIWRAVIPLTPIVRGKFSEDGQWIGLERGYAFGEVRSLRPIYQSGKFHSLIVSSWFPSVRQHRGQIYLAHNRQYNTRRSGNYSLWSRLLGGIEPVDSTVNFLAHSRFPTFSKDTSKLAYMEWGEDDINNVEVAELDSSTLSMGTPERVSHSSALFEGVAGDPTFAFSQAQTCVAYHGAGGDSGNSLPMLACRDGEDEFSERVSEQVSVEKCGHPSVTGDGRWLVCSGSDIYAYPLFTDISGDVVVESGLTSRAGAQYLQGEDGDKFINLSPLVTTGTIQFGDRDGNTISPDRIEDVIQTYSSWGGTDFIVVFTAMPSEIINKDGEDKKQAMSAKIFAINSSLSLPVSETDLSLVVDLSELITQKAIKSGLIEGDNATKLSYCTADFFVTESSE